ncbi:21171_t:CDS:2, partial [Entrophospora sp. SA101]
MKDELPSQNFFNNSVKSLSDNNRFYLDNNAKSSDEMNSNVEDDVEYWVKFVSNISTRGNDYISMDLIKELKENKNHLIKISNQNEKIIKLLQEQKDVINSLKNEQIPSKKHPSCWID